jgi:hypothetical protein
MKVYCESFFFFLNLIFIRLVGVIGFFFKSMSNFSAISWREQVNFQWDDDEVRFVLDQHT